MYSKLPKPPLKCERIVSIMLTELLYPLQECNTPLHDASSKGRSAGVELLLSITGIDVNIKNKVSFSIPQNSIFFFENLC